MTASEERSPVPLNGRGILVTSGPTRAYLDRVRYLSNTSTGELGARIAQVLYGKGASVLFIYGSGSCTVEGTDIYSREICEVQELETVIREVVQNRRIDGVVHAMAVLDYVSSRKFQGKKPSDSGSFTVTFIPAPKVIRTIRDLLPQAVLISFKLEAGVDDETLKNRAYDSLMRYNSDYVVANDINRLTYMQHPALVINAAGEIVAKCETKQEISLTIASLFVKEFSRRSPGENHPSIAW